MNCPRPDVPQAICSANACSQVLMPFSAGDLKHRGTEITEPMSAGISVFSVPLCFVLLTSIFALRLVSFSYGWMFKLDAPPTIGSSNEVPSRSIVSSVPGSGQRVKSRSLEKIIRPICWPALMTWSSGCSGKVTS